MPSAPLPRIDLLSLRGKNLMCLQITDMNCAVQKILSDHRALSRYSSPFQKHRKSGKGSESKLHLLKNAFTTGRTSILILPGKLYRPLSCKGGSLHLTCLYIGCFLLFASLNLIFAQCYFLSQASLIPYPNHSQD